MACLSSRIPYGTPVTLEALEQIGRERPSASWACASFGSAITAKLRESRPTRPA